MSEHKWQSRTPTSPSITKIAQSSIGGRAVHPDHDFDRAKADFVDGLVVHDWFSFAARGSIPSVPRSVERGSRLANGPSRIL
jgi:hypothetical protein